MLVTLNRHKKDKNSWDNHYGETYKPMYPFEYAALFDRQPIESCENSSHPCTSQFVTNQASVF